MCSPLEQFIILPLIPFFFNLSITNEFIFLVILLVIFYILYISLNNKKSNTFYILSNTWQTLFNIFYNLILSTLLKNVGDARSEKFFPLVFNIFMFILFLNLIGLIPNSFTLPSHLIVTFALSVSLFIGITIICVITHKIKFFSLFLPSGTPTGLAFLLIPIEVISYIFKPLSLSIRLFANLMAGHALMHVIAGFGINFLTHSSSSFMVQFLPVIIILPLLILDIAVCSIQAFVYSILICLYINDALSLH